MSSEAFQQLENKVGDALVLQSELVERIANKLKQEQGDIECALYTVSVATGARPLDAAFIVHEFLAALTDILHHPVVKEDGSDER